MQLLYSFLITCYGLGIRIAAIFDPKAALWVKGRKDYFAQLQGALMRHLPDRATRKTAWFHCASLGEFEQGRPLIEAFRKQYPDWYIVLTFFSPSGYEVRKSYAGADLVAYLPLDTRRNARRFTEMVNPGLVFYIKYEFWFNFLTELQSRRVPTLLVSAVFRPEQHFFKWYGEWPRKILKGFTAIFVQNESSAELLQFINIPNAIINGDTRFDRVADVAAAAEKNAIASAFAGEKQVLVAGSTWPADENLIFSLRKGMPDLKIIIAPHEVKPDHLAQLRQQGGRGTVLYSETDETRVRQAAVLIIDSVGMLSRLYRYGTLAYIGGGFGVGIHNILEPAAFGLPVFFGPNYHKFEEAKALAELKGAFPVNNAEELAVQLASLINDPVKLETASQVCAAYVSRSTGATAGVMKVAAGLVQDGRVRGLNC